MYMYPLTILGTLAALCVYLWAMVLVGRARKATGIAAPATSGHPEFERAFRAHQNTLEQLVIFLPLVWIVAVLFGDAWGGIYGAVWAIGRIAYTVGYIAAPLKRAAGFFISALASLAALVGSIVAVVMDMMR